MPLPQELYEDLRKEFQAEFLAKGRVEGRVEGELRRARAAVLEAFDARFERVPAAVGGAVAGTDDLELLGAWHRAVVRAPDLTAAERAIVGAR